MQALEGATLGNGENSISKKIDTLSLGQIIKIDSSSPQILQALEGATLGNGDDSITNKMNSISLGEVMKIDSNSPKLLQSLSGTKINELGTAVSELKLNDMMDVGDNFILKHLKDSTLSTLPDDISELTIEDVFADDIYDEHGNMKGTWKYLLDNDISTDEEIEKHSLNDMGTLITNMTENFQKATLKDLKADGILPGLSDELLTTNIPFILKPRPNATTYGDLNITELFNLVGKLG